MKRSSLGCDSFAMGDSAPADVELLADIASDDEAAPRELYDRHAAWLLLRLPRQTPGRDSIPRCVKRNEAIDFYKSASLAEELIVVRSRDGRVSHTELRIGDAILHIHDEFLEVARVRSQSTLGGTMVTSTARTLEVDAMLARALAADATLDPPPADAYWGARFLGRTATPGRLPVGRSPTLERLDIGHRDRTGLYRA